MGAPSLMPRSSTSPTTSSLRSSLLRSTPSPSFRLPSTCPPRPVSPTVLPTPSRLSWRSLLSLRSTPSTRPRPTRLTLLILVHFPDLEAEEEEAAEELPLKRSLRRSKRLRRPLLLLTCSAAETATVEITKRAL